MTKSEKKEPHRADEMAVNLEDFVITVVNANLLIFETIQVEEVKSLETIPCRNNHSMSFFLELSDNRHKKGDMGRMSDIDPYFETLFQDFFSLLRHGGADGF